MEVKLDSNGVFLKETSSKNHIVIQIVSSISVSHSQLRNQFSSFRPPIMISCVFISLSFSAPAFSYLSIMSSSSRRKSLPLPTYGPLLSFFLSFFQYFSPSTSRLSISLSFSLSTLSLSINIV